MDAANGVRDFCLKDALVQPRILERDGKAAQRIAGIVNELMMQNDEVVK